MPQFMSPYPWRTANDADFDITGRMMPQGAYRSVVWGSEKTYLFSMHPETFGKEEIISMWGFPAVLSNWNYAGYENRPVELVVFSGAEEVELFVNGRSLGRKAVNQEKPMRIPCVLRQYISLVRWKPSAIGAVRKLAGICYRHPESLRYQASS